MKTALPPLPPPESEILAIIRAAADRHGVPRQVALAFAWCESRLNSRAKGDLQWSQRKMGTLYRKHVLDAPRFTANPAREHPETWHSYGLFQLLACYHVEPLEHPSVLFDPAINADRGCRQIAQLLKRTNGDVRGARLAYVGCGTSGELCSEHIVSETTDRLLRALERFASEARR